MFKTIFIDKLFNNTITLTHPGAFAFSQ